MGCQGNWLAYGYWLTSSGLKPWKKKIEAVLRMGGPQNATEPCMFIGCNNNYHDMWPSCAHVLNLRLINQGWRNVLLLTGQMKCNKHLKKCAYLCLLMLYQPTQIITNVLISTQMHPNFNSACIMQEGRLVAYFSKKLSKSHGSNTTMEKEMLSIDATLDEF